MKRSTVIALAVSALGLSACQEDFAVKDVYEICENITCGDHGTCIPTSAISAICVCDVGYHNNEEDALVCDADVDPCADVSCSNHGQCLINSQNEPVCVCDNGYHNNSENALVCDANVDPCADVTCSEHGVCLANSQNEPVCVCDNGYHNNSENALACDADVDPCADVTCSDHGVCVNANNAAVCICDSGFHATSDAPTTCVADEVPVNPCADVTCSDHGVCLLDTTNAPICMCESGYVNADATTCTPSSVDLNSNYMRDVYETAPDQGISCITTHNDGCTTGFCDSFMNYRCSTRCTDDSQCISDDYICRSDGRCVPKAFETIWTTTSNNEALTIPGGQGTCDYTVDWGDGSTDDVTACKETLSHVYASAGAHHVKITGTIQGWACNGNCAALTEVVSFGPVELGAAAFKNATKLSAIASTDIPNAKALVDMSYMFSITGVFKVNLDLWDTSHTQNMAHAFEFAGLIDGNRAYSTFNADIRHWDTSNVTDMSYMFLRDQVFNQDLSLWDTSKVTTMEGMFSGASSFNQNLSLWNTSNVTTMRVMFKDAAKFNGNISGWNTSKVTTMKSMFSGASSFNQPLGHWNMSSIEDLSFMFNEAHSYEGTGMSTWAPGKLKYITGMCLNAYKFNEPLTMWDVSQVAEIGTSAYENAFKNTNLSLHNFISMTNTNENWKKMDVISLGLPDSYK